jgi:hypothetical protein
VIRGPWLQEQKSSIGALPATLAPCKMPTLDVSRNGGVGRTSRSSPAQALGFQDRTLADRTTVAVADRPVVMSGRSDILWGQRPRGLHRRSIPTHRGPPDEWRPSTWLCPLLLGESAELQVVASLGFYHVRRVADQEFVLVFRRQVAEEYIHYEAVLEGYEAPGQESGWR